MVVLKNKLVRFRSYMSLKKVHVRRESVGYRNANVVGIIFSAGDLAKHENIKRLVRMLENDGKKVKVISYLPRKKENHEFLFDFFRYEDVSIWGHFKSENINRFIGMPFDYLFHVDESPNIYIEQALAKSAAKCRIGAYMEKKSHYYEMMVKTQTSDIQELVDQLYFYTKSLI